MVENNNVVAVKANGEIIKVSAVISTAPANILAKIVKGTEVLRGFSQFRFRPVIFINLRLEGKDLLPDTVLWFPENKFPFFRVTEVTRSMPWLAPPGKSIITVDIGCQKDDEYLTMDEKVITDLCLQHLKTTVPDIHTRLLGSNVLKTPIAYPVFLNQYEKNDRISSNQQILTIS